VRTKHFEKIHVGLWGHTEIMKVLLVLQIGSEQTISSTMWFMDEQSGSLWACKARDCEGGKWSPVHKRWQWVALFSF